MDSLKKFKENKLTTKELNDFKIELHSKYINMLQANNDFFKSKEEKQQGKIDNQELEKYKAKSVEAKAEFKKICGSKIFIDNYKTILKIYNSTTKKNSSIILEQAKEELNYAKNLKKEFKDSVKDHGRGAQLTKLDKVAVKVENLKFKYAPDFPYALNEVNFEINDGEYVAVIGHNGSGKSTLSKILIGVLSAQEGHVSIYGNVVTRDNLDQARKFLGIVFQNPDNQFIGSSVEADIAFGLENKRVNPKDMQKIIYDSAKKVGMENFLDKEPLNLSGGQKQRVAIASALALNPDILIFDEATSMLDPKGNREIKEIMVELRDKMKKTIISITHDMDEILNADKVIVMNAGRLVKIGKPEEVLKDKEFLRGIKLEIPFLSLVEEALDKEGIKIKHSQNMDELVKQLCK
ncbi:energy-coupling factor transporter ATPase [Mesoplasma chauliocola]|uniref:Energy-coupling factor transporter ATPase n=1 Tax=Mesoplasma chauliocola TaxID=216427 RepID=A0A249SMT4_9MOLU|nr:energy-coupling factor transporter ATPase [Mesoplasma chauliocola]ASZ08912.1 energy-coupling factor transporter ATPase [Mesoplasma chauliocola]